jgi:hypothetical protein
MTLRNTKAVPTLAPVTKRVEIMFAHMKQRFRFTRLKRRDLTGAAEESYLSQPPFSVRVLMQFQKKGLESLP